MLDAGWPLEALKAVPLLARAGGFRRICTRNRQRPIGFILSHHADLAIAYDGEMPRPRQGA
jgi:citrate synthase